MLSNRVIPVLLVKDHGLVKTRGFDQPTYVGDPINAIRIFNEKEVDELALLDIDATPMNWGPNFELVQDVASECFMPLAYGGGIRGLDDAKRLFNLGVEKVILRSTAATNLPAVTAIATYAGSSSVTVSIDVLRGRSAEALSFAQVAISTAVSTGSAIYAGRSTRAPARSCSTPSTATEAWQEWTQA